MNKVLSLLILPCAIAAHAQSSCSSDNVPAPRALLERFVNADCANCWSAKQTPEAASGTLAVDWVTPGAKGDDAPLSAAATLDGVWRLAAVGARNPPDASSRFTQRTPPPLKLRVAHGLRVNDYVGTSIEIQPAPGGPWKAWLLLVENLPAGTEGSPVERNLVRNSFSTEWPAAAKGPVRRYELRPMRVPEGAKFSRLRVVGWVEDSHGKIAAIAQSRCAGQ
jgi:hypothetical protein